MNKGKHALASRAQEHVVDTAEMGRLRVVGKYANKVILGYEQETGRLFAID